MKKVFPESFPRIRILKKTTELLFLANLCNIRTYVRMYIRVYYLSNLLTKNVSNPTGQYRTVPYKKKPKKSIFAGYPCHGIEFFSMKIILIEPTNMVCGQTFVYSCAVSYTNFFSKIIHARMKAHTYECTYVRI